MFKSELWESMDNFKGFWHSNPANIHQAAVEPVKVRSKNGSTSEPTISGS